MERKGRGRKIIWSAEDDAYIREHFPFEPACDIAEHFGITAAPIIARAKALGVEKADGYDPKNFYGRFVHKGNFKG